jgi:hypothetical protein
MRRPKRYTISYEDAVRACREFDDHRCDDSSSGKVGREGDRILICTGEGSLKAKNTRRDPRVSLSIAGNGLPVYLSEMGSMYLKSPSRTALDHADTKLRLPIWVVEIGGSPGLLESADYGLMKLPHVADVSTHRWQRSSM